MKKTLIPAELQFHYGEAFEYEYGAFAEILQTPSLLDYPRPVLMLLHLQGPKPKKNLFQKLVTLTIGHFGAFAYAIKGNNLYVYSPNGSAKAEVLTKARDLIMEYGDLDGKTTYSTNVVLAYPRIDNTAGLLQKMEEAADGSKNVVVFDDIGVDPTNVTYLSDDEVGDLSFDIAKSLGFASVGIGRIIPNRNRVEILSESGRASFSRLGKAFSLERLLPFVSLANDDPYFFIGDARNLPSKPMAILDSVGAVSAIIRFFKEKDQLRGFAYATSTRNVGYLGKEEAKAIEDFFVLSNKRFLTLALRKAEEEANRDLGIMTTLSDAALLRLDQKQNIVSLSPNLKAAYPNARINDKAVKAWPHLFGEKHPAQNGDHVMLPELGSGTYCFHFLSQDEEGISTYIFSRLDEIEGSRKRETDTGIYTRSCYDNVLLEETLAYKKGALLFVRLANADMIASKVKPPVEIKEVMDAFIAYLFAQGYGFDLYRYDENTLVYVLPKKEKEEAKQIAIALATKLSKITKLGRFSAKPLVDYLLLGYPVEVANNVDADSFVRSLFGKADDFGHGRLSELNKERGRLLLASAYEEEAVKKAMVDLELPFRLTPVKDAASNAISFLHLDLDVHGEDGDEILPPNVISAAKRTQLLTKMMGLAQDKLALSYLEDSKTMKALGYKGVLFHFPMELMEQDAYYNNFLKAIPHNRDYLYLRFGEGELQTAKAVSRLNDLKAAGFKLALEDYRHEVYYDFDAYITMLGDLTTGSGDKGASFLTLCQKHARAGKVVMVGFVDDPQGIAFLLASHLAYAMGQAAGRAIPEKDLMTSIRNKRKAK